MTPHIPVATQPQTAPRRGEACVEELLLRMRAGDRDAAGEFLVRYGPRLRARVRHRLGPGTRRIFDSQEILSTVARRLDVVVRDGRVEASTEGELWSLVMTICRHAIAEKGRVVQRLRRVEDEDSPFARAMLARIEQADARSPDAGEGEIERAFAYLTDPLDRQILGMWLSDMTHAQIAACLDMPAGTVRWRWSQIRQTLAATLENAR